MIVTRKSKLLGFLSVLWLCVSCSSNCLDPSVDGLINQQITTIQQSLKVTKTIAGETMLSVFVLQEITGIKSSVRFGDTSVDSEEADFFLDRKKWKRWVNEYGCSITFEELTTIIQCVRNQHPYLVEGSHQFRM